MAWTCLCHQDILFRTPQRKVTARLTTLLQPRHWSNLFQCKEMLKDSSQGPELPKLPQQVWPSSNTTHSLPSPSSFLTCPSFPNVPVAQGSRPFCAGGKNYNHRIELSCVTLSSQSPADYLIGWQNVLFNLLELVISSSVISLYFWLDRLKILIYQWHL